MTNNDNEVIAKALYALRDAAFPRTIGSEEQERQIVDYTIQRLREFFGELQDFTNDNGKRHLSDADCLRGAIELTKAASMQDVASHRFIKIGP